MVDWLTTTIIVAALLLAAWSLLSTARDQPMVVPHLAGMAVLELLLITQGVVSAVRLAGGERPEESITFVSYLATVVLLPPASAVWGLIDRSRWGPAVIAVACLTLAVMVVRLRQLWEPAVG